MRVLCLRAASALAISLIAASASAVTMDWTPIGNPGNACDPVGTSSGLVPGCFGAVGYEYYIGTFEVTNAQYAEFLNAKAATDPLGLYNTSMASGDGGITRSGSSGSYTYTVRATFADKPVNLVSFYDTLRFTNWMNNGQGSGDTETGAYTLLGGTATPSNGTTVTRNAGATIVLTSESEWYKAAYYDPSTSSYFDYPTATNTQPTCSLPTATANRANCNNAVGGPTVKGSYSGSASPFGTFDQAGNVYEFNETIPIRNAYVDSHGCGPNGGLCREIQGGWFSSPALFSRSDTREVHLSSNEGEHLGFRLAYIPEPSTGLLVIAGLLGFGGWRRATG